MTACRRFIYLLALLGCVSLPSNAFIPHGRDRLGLATSSRAGILSPPTKQFEHPIPLPIRRSRRSVGVVQTMGLFGLGAPEIIIILVAAAFLLGPQKIAELGKDAGKIAGELKEVPKEFQKGLEEGETEARSKKAKQMEELPPELDKSERS